MILRIKIDAKEARLKVLGIHKPLLRKVSMCFRHIFISNRFGYHDFSGTPVVN